MAVPTPSSLTHQHIAAIIATEEERRSDHGVRTVLDAGCGEGAMLGFLHQALPSLTGLNGWNLNGFDVHDSTSRRHDFPQSTISYLTELDRSIEWWERISVTGAADPWPYPDQTFDYVLTNQVLEHVVDLGRFLGELRRVLAPGGVSIHLFPLRNALFEGHLSAPVAAQIQGHEQRQRWLQFLYRLKLGGATPTDGLRAQALEGADYIHFATHYRSWSVFMALAKRVGLRISYRYTREFYEQKVRQIVGLDLSNRYHGSRRVLADWLSFTVLRYAASVTLVLERPDTDSRFHRY